MSLSRLRPLALALLAGGSLACARTPPEPPNLVVIVVDTLRADHLGAYGYAPPTSPTIDGLAERGALFEAAYSTAAYTRPSTASILTGHYPSVHGAVTHADSIGPGIATLAERLQGAGYRTAGFYRNGNVGPRFGFARGFDEYVGVEKRHRRERRRRGEGAGAAEKNSETGDWLVAEAAIPALDAFRKDRAETGRPFFLYLHLADPHDPYTPPRDVLSGFLDGPLLPELELFYTQPRSAMTENPSVLRRLTTGQLPWRPNTLEQIVALYDAEIAASDAVIGRVLGHLESLGLAEETVVVVTSDHGEELFERGNSGHGHSHFEEQLHVPLVIAGAGVERRRIRGPVSLI
ncbi:MAG: sulfatase, partial [Acidobacteriota bacterium]